MFKYLLAFLCIFQACFAEFKYNLSVCAIFQEEAPYLKEWIEFHKLVGVEHFYLYNNRSTDNYLEVLKPYIEDGTVELEDDNTVANDIKTYYPMQYNCYTRCLKKVRDTTRWVAFIDIDEFLFPLQEMTLPAVLKNYESYGGLRVNWLIFGTSNVKKIPENMLLIEALTKCTEPNYPDNRFVKAIVQPNYASHFESAHEPIYNKGYCGVNTDKMPGEGYFSDYIRSDKLRINHYWSRDEHFFYTVKAERHKKWGGKPDINRVNNIMNKCEDTAILKYVPALKKTIN